MCGIVGAIAQREASRILLEGLKRLEYRGYDSAGLALVSGATNRISTIKTVGKVGKLVQAAKKADTRGKLGIAHTRWATHGKPTVTNAHPHNSHNQISVVHNGIIENYVPLRDKLIADGYEFKTETDTETIVHLIHQARKGGKVSLLSAVKKAIKKLHGAYG
ncbi:MAG: class II glutamine amidotransferase, partial [Gammaproteobacteria bacterium]|nr:class II glutamine amidotransferase [Gammaproteobacteria bacterium]